VRLIDTLIYTCTFGKRYRAENSEYILFILELSAVDCLEISEMTYDVEMATEPNPNLEVTVKTLR